MNLSKKQARELQGLNTHDSVWCDQTPTGRGDFNTLVSLAALELATVAELPEEEFVKYPTMSRTTRSFTITEEGRKIAQTLGA